MRDEYSIEIVVNINKDGNKETRNISVGSTQIVTMEIMNNITTIFPVIKATFNFGLLENNLLNFSEPEIVFMRVNTIHDNMKKVYDCYIYSLTSLVKNDIDSNGKIVDITLKAIGVNPTKLRLFMSDESDYTKSYTNNSLHILKSVLSNYDVKFSDNLYVDDYMKWNRIKQNDIQFINYIRNRMNLDIPLIVFRHEKKEDYFYDSVFITDFSLIKKSADINLTYDIVSATSSVKNYYLNYTNNNELSYNDKICFSDDNFILTNDKNKLNIKGNVYRDYNKHLSSNGYNIINLLNNSGSITINNIDLVDFSKLELLNVIDIEGDKYIITQLYYKYIQKIVKPILNIRVKKI